MAQSEANRRYEKSAPGQAKRQAAARRRYAVNGGREKNRERGLRYLENGQRAAWRKSHSITPKGRLGIYKASARQRSMIFALTFEQFMSFWRKPCHYCASPIETVGLDRIDNSIGYTFSNVVPCCSICNHMKRNWPLDAFIAQCWNIVLHAGMA